MRFRFSSIFSMGVNGSLVQDEMMYDLYELLVYWVSYVAGSLLQDQLLSCSSPDPHLHHRHLAHHVVTLNKYESPPTRGTVINNFGNGSVASFMARDCFTRTIFYKAFFKQIFEKFIVSVRGKTTTVYIAKEQPFQLSVLSLLPL